MVLKNNFFTCYSKLITEPYNHQNVRPITSRQESFRGAPRREEKPLAQTAIHATNPHEPRRPACCLTARTSAACPRLKTPLAVGVAGQGTRVPSLPGLPLLRRRLLHDDISTEGPARVRPRAHQQGRPRRLPHRGENARASPPDKRSVRCHHWVAKRRTTSPANSGGPRSPCRRVVLSFRASASRKHRRGRPVSS